jgi:hypothetical protein
VARPAEATASHAAHDLDVLGPLPPDAADELVARAAAQVAACPACSEIDADLRSLVVALRALGTSEPVRPAPRDFRLSVATAGRIRPRGPLGWLVRQFGSRGVAAARGVATGLVAIGLVGVLVSGWAPAGSLGGAAGGTEESGTVKDAATAAPAMAPAATMAATSATSSQVPGVAPAPAGRASAEVIDDRRLLLTVSVLALLVGVGLLLAAGWSLRRGR